MAQPNKIKPMPDREKYKRANEMVRAYQKHVLPFVQERLSYEAMHELSSIWQAGITPIHEEYRDRKKYECAYSNWSWMARCSHDFLAERFNHEDVIDYKRLLLRLYKDQHENSNSLIFPLFWNPTSMAKALLYEMQWMTPVEITNSNKSQITCTIRECKILQTPGVGRVCRVDCQNIGKAYANMIYGLNRSTTIINHGCTIAFTPLEL